MGHQYLSMPPHYCMINWGRMYSERFGGHRVPCREDKLLHGLYCGLKPDGQTNRWVACSHLRIHSLDPVPFLTRGICSCTLPLLPSLRQDQAECPLVARLRGQRAGVGESAMMGTFLFMMFLKSPFNHRSHRWWGASVNRAVCTGRSFKF